MNQRLSDDRDTMTTDLTSTQTCQLIFRPAIRFQPSDNNRLAAEANLSPADTRQTQRPRTGRTSLKCHQTRLLRLRCF